MNALHRGAASSDPAVLERFHSSLALVDARAGSLFRSVRALGIVTLEDLRGFGREGLFEAARTYDDARGVAFGAWAHLHVNRAMLAGLRRWGYSRRQLRRLQQGLPLCLHGSGPQAALRLEALGSDRQLNPEELLEQAEREALLRAAIANLPALERDLIENYDLREESLDHAARAAGISKSWASRLRSGALERLSHALGVAEAA